MKSKMRIWVTVLCLTLAMATSIVYVGAAQVDGGNVAEPMWTNTSSVQVTIVRLDGVGYAETLVMGKFGATAIKTDVYVFQLMGARWIYVTELHDIQYDQMAGVSCPFEAALYVAYRVEFKFTVTMNGTDEVINRTEFKTFT